MSTPFHLSITVSDLEAARRFYVGLLGCPEGRSAPTWIDFDFFGHQLSVHLGAVVEPRPLGQVDGTTVPMPHFGAVLPLGRWSALAERLTSAGIAFELPPQRRFVGEAGEQALMFFRDPSGNAIEIKGFATTDRLFEV
ncbi:VOC family protein [Caulobacter sp. ErkDOM-YI]|uniref:VOC family protein n=1 Tax=unclassified Caulobacter TaxID=2648921 RepID=UPI003AF66C46